MDTQEFEKKKFEYQMAQEMLRHYDALNWQIGSILIAGVVVLTGFVINKDIIELAKKSFEVRWMLNLGIPFLSLFVLGNWLLWFRRHRFLYNFRNEVLHRLEIQLGMYHFLRVAAADIADIEQLASARKRAGHDSATFTPLYPLGVLTGLSGYTLAKVLALGIPFAQLVLLYGLYRV